MSSSHWSIQERLIITRGFHFQHGLCHHLLPRLHHCSPVRFPWAMFSIQHSSWNKYSKFETFEGNFCHKDYSLCASFLSIMENFSSKLCQALLSLPDFISCHLAPWWLHSRYMDHLSAPEMDQSCLCYFFYLGILFPHMNTIMTLLLWRYSLIPNISWRHSSKL